MLIPEENMKRLWVALGDYELWEVPALTVP
jgi:hypothetical protein